MTILILDPKEDYSLGANPYRDRETICKSMNQILIFNVGRVKYKSKAYNRKLISMDIRCYDIEPYMLTNQVRSFETKGALRLKELV